MNQRMLLTPSNCVCSSAAVPREPFSFGGLYGTKSKYGDMDITGDAATEFFTNRIKITTKWPIKRSHAEMEGTKDSANFAGQM